MSKERCLKFELPGTGACDFGGWEEKVVVVLVVRLEMVRVREKRFGG